MDWHFDSSIIINTITLERDRKAEHIALSLKEEVQSQYQYFDAYTFEHAALPEIAFEDIDTSVDFLGKQIGAPLLISSMTGGTASAKKINENLAAAAEVRRLPLALGSQRKAIEDPNLVDTFNVRSLAPTIPVLANVGAVQLNYGFGLDECKKIIDMVDADALIFHLNPLQEVLQPEGQTNFAALLPKLRAITMELDVPVVAKEIGCGLSKKIGAQLVDCGIRILDSSGVGGTSWARIESYRSGDLQLGDLYAEWGIPTPLSIRQLRELPGVTVIGSGGVRSGLDVAKAVALGADLSGLASPFLKPAMESVDAVLNTIDRVIHAFKVAMFCVGAPTVAHLRRVPLYRRTDMF